MSAGKECTTSHNTDPPADTDPPIDTDLTVGYAIASAVDPSLSKDICDSDTDYESFEVASNSIRLKSDRGERY